MTVTSLHRVCCKIEVENTAKVGFFAYRGCQNKPL